MELVITPKGTLQIDNARITWTNFEGKDGPYNDEGDRFFTLVIPDEELADRLIELGWNIKKKPALTEDEPPFMTMKVKLSYNDTDIANGVPAEDVRGPIAYLKSGVAVRKLTHETIGCLDGIQYESVDLDIRPYDWNKNGRSGRTAYLNAIHVVQRIEDRFASRYDTVE